MHLSNNAVHLVDKDNLKNPKWDLRALGGFLASINTVEDPNVCALPGRGLSIFLEEVILAYASLRKSPRPSVSF